METEQYRWLQFAPELPSLGEFAVIFLYVGCLILAGKLFKSWWERDNETVPIPVALGMGVAMLAMFFVLIAVFYSRTAESHMLGHVVLEDGRQMEVLSPGGDYMGILVWCLIALVFPLFYYGLIIVNSFTSRVIDRVSPFGMQIQEPSEFAEARKMALRGDVDGAVKRYRAYLENTEGALFEAARLLKSEDRFSEAAVLFQEIEERFFGKKLVWAEATFHLAKLRESHLHQAGEAMILLDQIVERTPESRFGLLARTELTRMQSIHGATPAGRDLITTPDTDDPFYDDSGNPVQSKGDDNGQRAPRRSMNDDYDVAAIPSVDPFFAAAQRRQQDSEDTDDDEGSPSEKIEKPKSSAKTPARKKAATKKKSAAKPKAKPKS